MANNGLVADDLRNALIKEMDSSISFPRMGSLPEYPGDTGTYAKFNVRRRKEVSEDLDDINSERASYLLNTDDALMELHS